jgi:hypothetical protein
VGFKCEREWSDDESVARTNQPAKELNFMHDLLIALAFLGMLMAPAVVAAKSNDGEPSDESE